MLVNVIPCENKKHLRLFIKLPYELHKYSLNWVPPLRMTIKGILSHKNPFFRQAKIRYWLAFCDNKPVGRIAGIINEIHNHYYGEKTAFWGFFETIDSDAVAAALLKTVETWALNEGMNLLRGPMNPSINYECGLQISAFETHPFVMMPQNPEYYSKFVEKQGHNKAKDLQAWIAEINDLEIHAEKFQMIRDLQKEYGVSIRPLNVKKFEEEIDRIVSIYNDAWLNNWGYLPLNRDEFKYLVSDFKHIMMAECIYFAEIDGEVCGFSVGIPDVNQIFLKLRSGKLTMRNLLKFIWHLKFKKTINQGRIPLLGVLKKYQHLLIGGMLYCEHFEQIKKTRCVRAEFSWILEDNKVMQKGLRLFNAKHYKTYRIYDKVLAQIE